MGMPLQHMGMPPQYGGHPMGPPMHRPPYGPPMGFPMRPPGKCFSLRAAVPCKPMQLRSPMQSPNRSLLTPCPIILSEQVHPGGT